METARQRAVKALNHIANQPEVIQAVAPGWENIDLSAFFNCSTNVMFGSPKGVVLFADAGSGVFEMHYLFPKAVRGAAALRIIREGIKSMFTQRGALCIVGLTPRDNRAARAMNRALGGVPVGAETDGQGRPSIKYALERATWEILSVD